MKWTYLLVNFCTIIVPFIFSFHPKLRFNREFKAFFTANILTAIVFIIWDSCFTDLGVWGFNPRYLLGINILNLPVEEVLFFICIPFSCVFTYHCLNIFYSIKLNKNAEHMVVFTLAFLLLVVGFSYRSELYTSTTFISLAFLILIIKYVLKQAFLGKLLYIYPVLLVPFFIVNGILTGTGIEEPVVWYNDSENMGIRLMTIPVEDIFYGFELILLNVLLFEFLKRRFNPELKGIA